MVNEIGKKRFTIFLPGLGKIRFGCCEPEIDDWRDIICEQGEYYVIHLSPTSKIETSRYHLKPDTLVAHGFYDQEHDANGGFIPVKDFSW